MSFRWRATIATSVILLIGAGTSWPASASAILGAGRHIPREGGTVRTEAPDAADALVPGALRDHDSPAPSRSVIFDTGTAAHLTALAERQSLVAAMLVDERLDLEDAEDRAHLVPGATTPGGGAASGSEEDQQGVLMVLFEALWGEGDLGLEERIAPVVGDDAQGSTGPVAGDGAAAAVPALRHLPGIEDAGERGAARALVAMEMVGRGLVLAEEPADRSAPGGGARPGGRTVVALLVAAGLVAIVAFSRSAHRRQRRLALHAEGRRGSRGRPDGRGRPAFSTSGGGAGWPRSGRRP